MKKFFYLIMLLFAASSQAQEILANVQVNYSQLGGSNTQTYKALEKNLRDFINNTSWTGRKLQNFEKIKSNFAIVLSSKEGSNKYKGSIVVQAVRPVFGTTYESPLLNLQDSDFSFEYNENENLSFNERQFSGKNLIDVISFYVYMILGYDGDSFRQQGGQQFFEKALKISQNSQNQRYSGWSQMEGPKTRGKLIETLMNPGSGAMRSFYYIYHRAGLDNLYKSDKLPAKKAIADAILTLGNYENNFQMNYPFNVMLDSKKDEIYNIFNSGSNGSINMNDLKRLLGTLSPRDSDKWGRLK